MAKPQIFILIGPPASGKGTQAQTLAEKYQIPHISTGNLIREEIQRGTERGKKYFSEVQSGKFPPDKVIMELLYERVTQADCKRGFILDGVPRTKQQAKLLEKYAKILRVKPTVIEIKVPDEMVIDRIVNRVTCQECGAPYHLISSPPKKEGICDLCGGAVVRRDDDSEEVMRNRLELYHEKTEPVIKFFEKKGYLHSVDGTLAKADVFTDITSVTAPPHQLT